MAKARTYPAWAAAVSQVIAEGAGENHEYQSRQPARVTVRYKWFRVLHEHRSRLWAVVNYLSECLPIRAKRSFNGMSRNSGWGLNVYMPEVEPVGLRDGCVRGAAEAGDYGAMLDRLADLGLPIEPVEVSEGARAVLALVVLALRRAK